MLPDVERHAEAEALDDAADRIRERLDAGAEFARCPARTD